MKQDWMLIKTKRSHLSHVSLLYLSFLFVCLTSIAAIRGENPNMELFRKSQFAEARLARLEGERYAPQQTEAYRRILRLAMDELSRQARKNFLFRNYASFNDYCADALAAAQIAMESARGRRQDLARKVTEHLRIQEPRLKSLRRDAARYGLSRGLRMALTRADVQFREAEISARHERWIVADKRISECGQNGERVRQGLDERMNRVSRPDLLRMWDRWVNETVDESARAGTAAIIVDKSAGQCALLQSGRVVRRYSADLGFNGIFDKTSQGDGGTPEGKYQIVRKNPSSKYFRALVINYPNKEDLREFRLARLRGQVHKSARVGGLIAIHGGGGRKQNWTEGCVAIRNSDMADLYRRVDVGTRVTIVGRSRVPTQMASVD